MNNFRYKLYQFMQGRRGIDQLGRFLLIAAVVLMLLSLFMRRVPFLYVLTYYGGVIVFVYAYFRAFSRNIYKRDMENQKFLAWQYKVMKGKSLQQWMYERKT